MFHQLSGSFGRPRHASLLDVILAIALLDEAGWKFESSIRNIVQTISLPATPVHLPSNDGSIVLFQDAISSKSITELMVDMNSSKISSARAIQMPNSGFNAFDQNVLRSIWVVLSYNSQ